MNTNKGRCPACGHLLMNPKTHLLYVTMTDYWKDELDNSKIGTAATINNDGVLIVQPICNLCDNELNPSAKSEFGEDAYSNAAKSAALFRNEDRARFDNFVLLFWALFIIFPLLVILLFLFLR